MPHTKKESKSIEKQIMKTNLIAYDIIDNMARNKFLPSNMLIIKNTRKHTLLSDYKKTSYIFVLKLFDTIVITHQ